MMENTQTKIKAFEASEEDQGRNPRRIVLGISFEKGQQGYSARAHMRDFYIYLSSMLNLLMDEQGSEANVDDQGSGSKRLSLCIPRNVRG
jgi:hypothetical protein